MMKPIHISTQTWSQQSNSVPPMSAAGAVPPLCSATSGGSSLSSTLSTSKYPTNIFTDVIRGVLRNFPQVKVWLKDPAMFIPGVLLAISLTLVLIIATVLWPYGLFQQAADRLWIHNTFLLTQYATTSSSAQKAAVAISMVVCGCINAMLFVVAAPIYLGRLYFTWISTAPVLHTSLSAACLLGLAIFIYVILPLLVFLAICSIIIAANER